VCPRSCRACGIAEPKKTPNKIEWLLPLLIDFKKIENLKYKYDLCLSFIDTTKKY
jgi:hypothetical protein